LGATEDGAQTSQQLAAAERLGEVVIGAGIERGNANLTEQAAAASGEISSRSRGAGDHGKRRA